MTRRLAALLSPLLAAAAAAQTFVVDEANGPGAHFTDLPTAVASVPDGAVLRVRAGTYDSPLLDSRSLTLIGEPGARLLPGLEGGLRISFLAPHQSIVLRGFAFTTPISLGTYEIHCRQCLGAVVLDQLGLTNPLGVIARIDAIACDRLLVRDSVFEDTCRVRDCHTVLTNCTLAPRGPGAAALQATRGTTQVLGGALQGANGFLNQGGPAVLGDHAVLRALSGALLAGGPGVPAGFAVAGTGSLRRDPSAAATGANPPFAAGVLATTAPQALVVVSDPVLGNPVTSELRGPDGDLGAIGVGLPGLGHAVPDIADRLFWAGSTAVTQAIGVIQAGVPVQAAIAVPNQPALLGLQLVWHGVACSPANGLQVSPPAWHVVRP